MRERATGREKRIRKKEERGEKNKRVIRERLLQVIPLIPVLLDTRLTSSGLAETVATQLLPHPHCLLPQSGPPLYTVTTHTQNYLRGYLEL